MVFGISYVAGLSKPLIKLDKIYAPILDGCGLVNPPLHDSAYTQGAVNTSSLIAHTLAP